MLNRLKELNSQIKLYDIYSKEFDTFGRVIEGLKTSEISSIAKKIDMPRSGCSYLASVNDFEDLNVSKQITDRLFGSMPTQIGYCYGYNSLLNAAEWHTSSEINIAITPLVLILGHIWDIKDGIIDSSKFLAFYLPENAVVEVYSTTLHFCPCQVSDSGFGCVVGLPKGTNTDLEIAPDNKLLFMKNKWIIAHKDNKSLIDCGVIPGIYGENFKINY